MNSKKKPVVKSLSTKPKKRIVRDASPAPDLPLDGTQRKLAESALQDDREGMEKVIEKAKINEEKLVAELVIANKELNFQNKEKEKRTAELVIANKELTFQNQEKEKRAAELVIANKELAFQNKEKEKRAAELVIANKELILKIVERKQVEEALLGSEARYRHLLDAMLEGCQIIGFDWRYLYVNDAVAQHGHQAKEILLGHTMMEIYPGIENTELFAALQRCMKERTPQQMENEFVYPDGMKGWFELSIQPVPEGIFILSIDITERKRVDQQLKEREALLNEVGVIAKLGGWEMDITTGKATWSKGTYDIVEIDYNKPVPGLHEHVGYYLPEYREMIESKMNALIETKQPMKFEVVPKTAKGNIKWCQVSGRLWRGWEVD